MGCCGDDAEVENPTRKVEREVKQKALQLQVPPEKVQQLEESLALYENLLEQRLQHNLTIPVLNKLNPNWKCKAVGFSADIKYDVQKKKINAKQSSEPEIFQVKLIVKKQMQGLILVKVQYQKQQRDFPLFLVSENGIFIGMADPRHILAKEAMKRKNTNNSASEAWDKVFETQNSIFRFYEEQSCRLWAGLFQIQNRKDCQKQNGLAQFSNKMQGEQWQKEVQAQFRSIKNQHQNNVKVEWAVNSMKVQSWKTDKQISFIASSKRQQAIKAGNLRFVQSRIAIQAVGYDLNGSEPTKQEKKALEDHVLGLMNQRVLKLKKEAVKFLKDQKAIE